ncbi:hypothetical protein SK128_004252 [Halocaridina rubra]|uniref:Uncharacterized protein n=1 Tax=Halocaridina rubra TaxID=373956 RepID=A0AAN8XM72_HALRR
MADQATDELDNAAVGRSPSSQPTTPRTTSILPYYDDTAPEDPDAQPVLKRYTLKDDDTEVIRIEKSQDENAYVNVVHESKDCVSNICSEDGKESPSATEAIATKIPENDTGKSDQAYEQHSNEAVPDPVSNSDEPDSRKIAEETNGETTEETKADKDSDKESGPLPETAKDQVAEGMPKTVEEQEVPPTNNHDSRTLDGILESGVQPISESPEMKGCETQISKATVKRHSEGDVTSVEDSSIVVQERPSGNHNSELHDTDSRSIFESTERQEPPENMKQSTTGDSFCEENSYNPGDFSLSSYDQSFKSEDMDESDLSLLTQLSERPRSYSEGDTNQMRVSFNSDEGDSDSNTYHAYINYGIDDDIMEDLTDLPHKTAHTHKLDEVPHLDTIQESDESDEYDEEEEKMTMPSTMKSKFSTGMLNLQDISSDGTDETSALVVDPETASDNCNSEKCISVEQESSSKSSGEEKDQLQDKPTDTRSQKRLKRGKIADKKSASPVFLAENLRTFSNPISYFGGPTIEYEENEGGGRSRNDSLASNTSLD